MAKAPQDRVCRDRPAKGLFSYRKQDAGQTPNKKAHPLRDGLSHWEPGSVLLSHGIPRTIIGAEAFHGPVRDGKAWDHLAIATRQNWLSGS